MANTSWSGTRTSFPARTRAAILARDPMCVACHERPSTIADHEPNHATLVRMGVPDPHDIRWGQGMCKQCHNAKTEAEKAAGRQRGKRPARRHPSDT